MKDINIMDKVNTEANWRLEGVSYEYSHHMYRNSAFEPADSCGNCNGANCELCKKIRTDAYIECTMGSDELYKWLLEKDVPEDIAADLAYSDYCGNTCRGYHLIWPTQDMLQEQYPDLYATITTTDEEVLKVINSYRGQFDYFGALRDAVKEHYKDTEDYDYYHIRNQMDLYWESCNGNHELACK